MTGQKKKKHRLGIVYVHRGRIKYTTNKQNETRNSRDKQNKQNGETFNQRENVTGRQLKKIHIIC